MASQQSEIYYVVKKGNQPGIYKTWPECKAAVGGHKYPVFRKFNSFNEANAFLKDNTPTTRNQGVGAAAQPAAAAAQNGDVEQLEPRPGLLDKIDLTSDSDKLELPPGEMQKIRALCVNISSAAYSDSLNYKVENWNCINDEIYIFTDGSAKKQSSVNSQSDVQYISGVGVYLGHSAMNIKEQYINKTNNQCELMALDYAFKLIIKYGPILTKLGKVIKIVSDSEYSIKACSMWLAGWKSNNWKTANGADVKNKELIQSIDSSMTRIKLLNGVLPEAQKIKVKLIHVNSHQIPDVTDKFKYSIWFGNYVADGLSQNTI